MGQRKRQQRMTPDAAAGSKAQIVQFIPALRAFARSLHRDIDGADDLVQETIIRALSALDTFEPGTSLKSWLFTIMRNTFYTRVKIAAREAPGAADCVSQLPVVNPTQEWEARGSEIMEALQRLPEHQREVLVLIAMLGVSYEETAQICKCAVGTVKSRLNRGRARLLAELHESSPASAFEQGVRHPTTPALPPAR